MEQKHFLFDLVKRYPQLALPIGSEVEVTEAYKNAVLRGVPVTAEPKFSFSEQDELSTEHTPVGDIDVILFAEREDFEHAYRALAYKCVNKEIPPSMGAGMISGIINREKINRHMEEYKASGGLDTSAEFKRFTSDKANYIDSLILLSSGYYSNVSPEAIGLDAEEWRKKSIIIRKYHELTHFVCRKAYPGNISTVRDEVLADMVGITVAFGKYDTDVARLLIGIDDNGIFPSGRLNNYIEPEEQNAAYIEANNFIKGLYLASTEIDYAHPLNFPKNSELVRKLYSV